MTKTIVVFAAIVVLSGCAQIDEYPNSWPTLQEDGISNDCPNINAVYENAGEKPDGSRVYLATWLAENTGRTRQEKMQTKDRLWKELFDAKTVAIELSGDSALNISLVGEGISEQWTIERNFQCKSGALSINSGGDKSGDNVLAWGNGSLDLYRHGHWLYVNSKGTVGGVMLIVPFVMRGSSWARFSLKEDQ